MQLSTLALFHQLFIKSVREIEWPRIRTNGHH